MFNEPYQYMLSVRKDRCGTVLGQVPVTVDWQPAREAVLFQAVRSGAEVPRSPDWQTQPLWHPQTGEPNIAGFRISLLAADKVLAHQDFAIVYFSALAHQASALFVKQELLKAGDLFSYTVQAIANHQQRQSAPRPRFTVAETHVPWLLREESLPQLIGGSVCFGESDEADAPLFIEFPILQAASVLTRQAGANEIGGVLIGHICRDSAIPEAFVRVTDLVPVPTDKPELTKFTFSSDSWTAVRETISSRGQAEVMVGWFHCHAFYYKTCGQNGNDRQQTCDARRPGLSEEDRHLHRMVFPRACCAALLICDAPCTGLSWSLFGWRKGQIVQRNYHVLGLPLPSRGEESSNGA